MSCEGVRSEPCTACPYKVETPSGVWETHEYTKLRAYDEPTFAQPAEWFACHATPSHACHGWAVVHNTRGGEYELLATRLHGIEWEDAAANSSVELFGSGNEAADHGQADIEDPSDEAIETSRRLVRKYERLRETT